MNFLRFSPALAILYLLVVVYVLLDPFEFSVPRFAPDQNSVEFDDEGVHFGSTGMLKSAAPPTFLHQQLMSGQGLTVELWLRSAVRIERGPARIVSYSSGSWRRNFTIGQTENDLDIRLRTTGTNKNATRPNYIVPDVFEPKKLQHIVVSYDFSEQRVYVDGALKAAAAVPQGNFETWDQSHFLILGNELGGGRPWEGTIAFAAIYNYPLDERHVVSRYKAGRQFDDAIPKAPSVLSFDFVASSELALCGANIGQTHSPPVCLEMPEFIPTRTRWIYSFTIDPEGGLSFSPARITAWDLVRNVLLFVPFGVFVFAWLEWRFSLGILAILATAVGAGLVSGTLEFAQVFLATRSSSVFDLVANVAGAVAGGAGCWCLLSIRRKVTGKGQSAP